MKDKTPDQIRRETVPAKHYWCIYGLLGGILGTTLWFGGWALFHREQVKRSPQYVTVAFQSSVGSFSLFGPPKHRSGMSAAQLRYALLRFGNEDHIYDAEIIRHGWYPKGAAAKSWVFYFGNVKPVFSDSAALVLKWPFTLSLFTFFAALVWGMVADYRYKSSIIAGVPLDGSIVATVDQYSEETHGDGMQYAVKAWKDR